MDVREVKRIVGGRARLIDNVSSARTLLRGKTIDVKEEEAKRALDAGIDILAPGCGIAPRTPLANVKALIEAKQEHK